VMQKRFPWELRQWASLGSVLWMIMAYTLWLRHFGLNPDNAYAEAQVQCSTGFGRDTYFGAQCLHNAIMLNRSQYMEAASGALLAAIAPVLGFWTILAGHYLWRYREPQDRRTNSESFYDLEWQARIEMNLSLDEATRPTLVS
jgi:hypothetical protein